MGHIIRLGLSFLTLGTLDWVLAEVLPSSEGRPTLQASISLGQCRRDFTAPAEAMSSFCPQAASLL